MWRLTFSGGGRSVRLSANGCQPHRPNTALLFCVAGYRTGLLRTFREHDLNFYCVSAASSGIARKNFTTIGIVMAAATASAMVWDIWMPRRPIVWLRIHRTGIKISPLRIMERNVAFPLCPILWNIIFPHREKGIQNRAKHWMRRAVTPILITAGSSRNIRTMGAENTIPISAEMLMTIRLLWMLNQKASRTRLYFFAP